MHFKRTTITRTVTDEKYCCPKCKTVWGTERAAYEHYVYKHGPKCRNLGSITTAQYTDEYDVYVFWLGAKEDYAIFTHGANDSILTGPLKWTGPGWYTDWWDNTVRIDAALEEVLREESAAVKKATRAYAKAKAKVARILQKLQKAAPTDK